jgi:hypothetical protein
MSAAIGAVPASTEVYAIDAAYRLWCVVNMLMSACADSAFDTEWRIANTLQSLRQTACC